MRDAAARWAVWEEVPSRIFSPDALALATSPVALSLLSKPGRQRAGTVILFSKILGAGTYKKLGVQAQNAGETKKKKKGKKEREDALQHF